MLISLQKFVDLPINLLRMSRMCPGWTGWIQRSDKDPTKFKIEDAAIAAIFSQIEGFEASASEAFSDQRASSSKSSQKFFTDRFFIRWNPLKSALPWSICSICSMWSRGATSYQMNCYQIVHLIAPWHLEFYDVQDGTDGVNVGVVGVSWISWISCVL